MRPAALIAAFMAVFLGMSAALSDEPDPPKDPLSRLVWDMYQMHHTKTMCIVNRTSLADVRANVIDYLKIKVGDSLTSRAVATAIWTLYPCPFSPARPELRVAARKDIEGAWLFPGSSQKLRFGPRSSQPSPAGPLPVKCDAVGYYPDGRAKHVIWAGDTPCPFQTAADLDSVEKSPQVTSWSLMRDGRVSINRTDVESHIEEWDMYTVTSPFSVHGFNFSAGDLLAYNRRDNGNELGIATEFRHLKKLP